MQDANKALTFGEWLSLVEHLVRDQGVGGSNPLSPTKHCCILQALTASDCGFAFVSWRPSVDWQVLLIDSGCYERRTWVEAVTRGPAAARCHGLGNKERDSGDTTPESYGCSNGCTRCCTSFRTLAKSFPTSFP